jgi:beta-hydroxylase
MQDTAKLRVRQARRLAVFGVFLAPALYFAPIPTLFLLGCGALDVSRHHSLTPSLASEYFTGKGLLTWLLSPINLVADVLSRAPWRAERMADLTPECRQEIEDCVEAFLANKDQIIDAMRPHAEAHRRVMLAFKWFGAPLRTGLGIAAFERNHRFVKTIAVSAFRGGEQTSWHFGPQRLTIRVLRNLEPAASPDVFVAIDDRVHRWQSDPLLIFDDTLFHRSVNDNDAVRYCLFLDVVRPSHFAPALDAAIGTMGLMAGPFRSLFYKNWWFVR